MKKIYRIKILKIIQTLFFNLSVGFVSSFLILGNFLLLIPQIFPIVLLGCVWKLKIYVYILL